MKSQVQLSGANRYLLRYPALTALPMKKIISLLLKAPLFPGLRYLVACCGRL